jgi:two-component system sensor kinase FixL
LVPAFIALAVLVIILVARVVSARQRERRLLDELEAAKSQLKESDRLVNVGQLVSGLAQDLKSPLQSMLGSAEVLAATEPGDAHAAQELKQIRDDVSRAAGIVRNLLAFTETTDLDRRWDDLNAIVRRAIQAHRTGATPDGVAFQGTTRLQLVYVDGRQIERVLTTLLSHTGHGSRNGAHDISVTTRRVNTPADLMVIDIDDPRASDADDIGTWSGDLDACRRVLQAHGGSLEVERQGSAGVRFHLEFPITELVETQAK